MLPAGSNTAAGDQATTVTANGNVGTRHDITKSGMTQDQVCDHSNVIDFIQDQSMIIDFKHDQSGNQDPRTGPTGLMTKSVKSNGVGQSGLESPS